MILLDTHTLLWYRAGERKIGKKARQIVDEAWRAEEAVVSAISFLEIGMLLRKGRLQLHEDPRLFRYQLLQDGLREIAVNGDIALRSQRLEDFHADPTDRIIAASALAEGYPLVTADRRMLDWPGPMDCLNAAE